jgi:hypothetical protein
MVGPAISEQQDVRYSVIPQEVVEEDRPVAKTCAKVGCRLGPISAVAGANIDPCDFDAPAPHFRREPMEQRPWRTLEKYEGALFRLPDRLRRPFLQAGRL